ncbi:alpha-hydroxy acid oxidase [Colwellia sp. MEBiC06753]
MSLKRCFNVEELRKEAKRKLPLPAFDYLEGGADDEVSLARNSDKFNDFAIVPNALVDVSSISIETKLLGCDVAMPFFISPVGHTRMFHHDSDLAGAKAAANLNTIFSLSNFASRTLEEVASSSTGDKMFQVYALRDKELQYRLLQRVKDAGYKALSLTVDCAALGNRERDHRNGLSLPIDLSIRSMIEFAKHPVWVWKYFFTGGRDLVNLENAPSSSDAKKFLEYMALLAKPDLSWKDAEEMCAFWQGPFVIKGILSVEDAKRAAEIGASAIMLSNHGGRQLDGTPAPIEMVAEIREAVGDQMEIIVDGGIRRGSDIFKALALGANGCSIGKAYAFALAAGGQMGVERMLNILKSELIRTMALAGVSNIKEINSSYIRKQ